MAIEAIEAGQPVKAPAPLRTKLILRRSLAAPRN
jgi:hypothetical protein